MLREHELVTTKVGIADLTPFAKIVVSGDQAREFLNHVVAGPVPKAGRTSLAHALTEGGKVMAEFTITGNEDGSFLVITGSGSELHDLRHLERLKLDGQWSVNISNVTDEFGVLSVAGPLSKEVLSRCLKKDLVDWRFLDARKCVIGGVECQAIRISYTGELGWEIYMPIGQMKPVYDALMDSGKDFEIGHFGTFVVNTLRLEKGFKMWGNEMNLDCTILEAGLDPFIKWNKEVRIR